MTRDVRPIVLVVALALVVAACGANQPHAARGDKAPAFVGTTLDGTLVNSDDLRGHPVLVAFWASWCEPCREELPMLNDAAKAAGHGDLIVLGVLFKDDPSSARAFAAKHGASWPTIIDQGDAIARSFQVLFAPQSYFIDPDGTIKSIQYGAATPADIERQLAAISGGL